MEHKGMGFKSAAKSVQKEGYSPKIAAAIIASSSRKAVENGSKNQNLKKVK